MLSEPQVLVVLGVSGSGKSTVGKRLAKALGWPFADGDDYHPAENVAKMHANIPLSDGDREPWLAALRGLIEQSLAASESLVLACSALKQAYRDRLQVDARVSFVYLHGDYATIAARLAGRKGHYMPAGLLQSQFDTLEEPQDALWIEIDRPLETMIAEILVALT